MRFLFKDLMVTTPDAENARYAACGVISCPLPTVRCGPLTCGITSVLPRVEFDAMKLDLDQALEIIRATVALESQTRVAPATVDEANELEEKLAAALQEVRKIKAELEKS
jgi:hypothetical protein